MRTRQRRLAELMREAREALGVRKNRQIWQALTSYNEAVDARLGMPVAAGMITPYLNDEWRIFWIDGQAREHAIRINAADLALPPESFVDRYIPH